MESKTARDRSAKEINEAGKIAKFYGFQPIIAPALEKQDLGYASDLNSAYHPAEKVALLRAYFEDKMMSLPQPNMLYCERPFLGLKEPGSERRRSTRLDSALVSIGSMKSVCECLSIQAAITILNAIGYKNLEVEINSMGDKDSINEFQRKLSVFIRKNISSFSADLRQAIKQNILAVFDEGEDSCKNFQAECPKSIDFLSESSRLHFKEVIEFLEIMNIPYEINHHLVSDLDIGSETVFVIKHEGEELASGFRFNRLAKRIGYKKEVPATVLNISARLKKSLKKVKNKILKPQFYLIQFGPEAKIKSFLVLAELYKAGVSVVHSIAKDKLGSQMGVAEGSEAPYIILIGQKEALDNSVIIRNTSTRAQEVVPIAGLAVRAKELASKHFA